MHAFLIKYEDQKFLTSVFTIQSFGIHTYYRDLKQDCMPALFTVLEVLELSCAVCDDPCLCF